LASPQTRRARLSFLPYILTIFFFFMINPSVISISFPWLIINFIYFYAPTITMMHRSNSFMDRSAIYSILLVLSIFVTTFETIVLCGKL
jgi:hypothetical protein